MEIRKTWAKQEDSTRNCYNAITDLKKVWCRLGHKIGKTPDGKLRAENILKLKVRCISCMGCVDFDKVEK